MQRDRTGLRWRRAIHERQHQRGAGGVGPIGKVAKEVRIAEMLIARRASPDPAALASETVRLKALLNA